MFRNIDTYATYGIAVLAFALSYSKLVDLALRAGYGELMAYAWPLIVDGLAVMAARAVMRIANARRYAWSLLIAGTAVSVFAAILNAMVPAGPLPPLAVVAVTVVPPLCLPFASHLARKMTQDSAKPSEQGTSHQVAEPIAEDQPEQIANETREETPGTEDDTCEGALELISSDGAKPTQPRMRKQNFTDAQKAEAVANVAAGMSQREAGRLIGASGNAVRGWIAKAQDESDQVALL